VCLLYARFGCLPSHMPKIAAYPTAGALQRHGNSSRLMPGKIEFGAVLAAVRSVLKTKGIKFVQTGTPRASLITDLFLGRITQNKCTGLDGEFQDGLIVTGYVVSPARE
jgi:hypothetical protein